MASRSPAPSGRTGRLAQLRTAYTLTRANDARLPLYVFGSALLVLAVFVLVGVLVHHPIYLTILGFLVALTVATGIFGRRANRAVFAQVEGQPGAAAAVLQGMRGNWKVTPVVAISRNQDLVHRAIGRPGIVLIGEGAPSRVTALIAQERKRIGRVAADTPVYDVQAGDAAGQVPLRKLQSHLTRLPRNLKPAQVTAVESRLRALGGATVPIPKGPLPRSGRVPRGKMR